MALCLFGGDIPEGRSSASKKPSSPANAIAPTSHAGVPGHWKTLTFVAALRHDRIEAPWVLDGPINGECFKTYVEKVLVPTLAPGDLVIMDNLGSHKGKPFAGRSDRPAPSCSFFPN